MPFSWQKIHDLHERGVYKVFVVVESFPGTIKSCLSCKYRPDLKILFLADWSLVLVSPK